MNENNGALADLPKFTMPVLANPEVVQFLEHALSLARAGKLTAVGMVMVAGPGQVNAGSAGGAMFEVNFGCDMLKAALVQNATGKRSPILQPVR